MKVLIVADNLYPELGGSFKAITDLSKTYQDPLLAKVKNQLRREFNFPRADIAKASKRKFVLVTI